MNKVTVTGNIISGNGITLFFANGTSQVLPADSFKTQAILEAVLPSLSRMAPIEIDLDAYSIGGVIEKVTNGAITVTGTITDDDVTVSTKHGTIKNAGALRKHIEDAAYGNSGKGLKLFMSHFVQMAKNRKHSADELMTFLQGADLPLADDGSIIGYKVLSDRGDYMVDPHSGVVKQKLGSLVFMPASKVSDDRRNACGVGLHIAARSYLKSFFYCKSPRLCLTKIKPGDVISVPEHERSKMRVCAYHIVKVLSVSDGEAIARKGIRIEDLPEAAKMLADVVAGNHTPIIQRVEITGDGKLTITDLVSKKPARKIKPTRDLRGATKMTVARAKGLIVAALPYKKKLAKAQRAYDDGMSIRDIAKKFKMDRESLGKNLVRAKGR